MQCQHLGIMPLSRWLEGLCRARYSLSREWTHEFPRAHAPRHVLPLQRWRGTCWRLEQRSSPALYSRCGMNGRSRTAAQAGDDTQPHGGRIGWLASLRDWLASAVSRRNRSVDGPRQDVGRLIARRAERVSNRKRDAADRYIAKHEILRRGK